MSPVIVILMLCMANAVTYQKVKCGLSTVPGDIPAATVSVDLSKNQIKVIDFFPILPHLRELHLVDNELTAFPNLINIAVLWRN